MWVGSLADSAEVPDERGSLIVEWKRPLSTPIHPLFLKLQRRPPLAPMESTRLDGRHSPAAGCQPGGMITNLHRSGQPDPVAGRGTSTALILSAVLVPPEAHGLISRPV